MEFFCTRSVGYSEGRQDREYRNVCSGTSEKLFLEGHSTGYNVHSAEETIEDLDHAIRKKNEQIGIWEKEIDELVDVRQARIGDGLQDRTDVSEISSRTVSRREDITEAKTEIKELQDLRAEAIIEYQKAIEEANEHGFHEETKIDSPETRDEANIYGTNP